MMTYKPFSIVVVPFPFVDAGSAKKRPAVVLSSEEFQKMNKHASLLMITSAKHSLWMNDHEIHDLDVTGLHAKSIVRQKIFTLDLRLIVDCIGKLSTKDRDAVIKSTQKHLKPVSV